MGVPSYTSAIQVARHADLLAEVLALCHEACPGDSDAHAPPQDL